MWCGQSFKSLAELTQHMKVTQHYTNIISQEQITSWRQPDTDSTQAQVNAILTCKVCDEPFGSLKDLSAHMAKRAHYSPGQGPPGSSTSSTSASANQLMMMTGGSGGMPDSVGSPIAMATAKTRSSSSTVCMGDDGDSPNDEHSMSPPAAHQNRGDTSATSASLNHSQSSKVTSGGSGTRKKSLPVRKLLELERQAGGQSHHPFGDLSISADTAAAYHQQNQHSSKKHRTSQTDRLAADSDLSSPEHGAEASVNELSANKRKRRHKHHNQHYRHHKKQRHDGEQSANPKETTSSSSDNHSGNESDDASSTRSSPADGEESDADLKDNVASERRKQRRRRHCHHRNQHHRRKNDEDERSNSSSSCNESMAPNSAHSGHSAQSTHSMTAVNAPCDECSRTTHSAGSTTHTRGRGAPDMGPRVSGVPASASTMKPGSVSRQLLASLMSSSTNADVDPDQVDEELLTKPLMFDDDDDEEEGDAENQDKNDSQNSVSKCSDENVSYKVVGTDQQKEYSATVNSDKDEHEEVTPNKQQKEENEEKEEEDRESDLTEATEGVEHQSTINEVSKPSEEVDAEKTIASVSDTIKVEHSIGDTTNDDDDNDNKDVKVDNKLLKHEPAESSSEIETPATNMSTSRSGNNETTTDQVNESTVTVTASANSKQQSSKLALSKLTSKTSIIDGEKATAVGGKKARIKSTTASSAGSSLSALESLVEKSFDPKAGGRGVQQTGILQRLGIDEEICPPWQHMNYANWYVAAAAAAAAAAYGGGGGGVPGASPPPHLGVPAGMEHAGGHLDVPAWAALHHNLAPTPAGIRTPPTPVSASSSSTAARHTPSR
ncbi:Protein tiptop [Fragariocoptes setiger]|uniref:Protein tiptop n=1 Tax=Fragariocoptes setiger TaxID=1670756 RepID=A0ABQ7SBU1_9ACAR|nr:Protein tiptop [Fragariocoptes setiger]